jgi:hypothetical protein
MPISLWLYSPLLDLGRLFSFLILHTVSRTPWTGDLAAQNNINTQQTHIDIHVLSRIRTHDPSV